MERLILKLYVSGRDPATDHAARELRTYCERAVSTNVDIEVVDVLESPEIAEEKRILATPTLVKEYPLPIRKVIGDFSDAGRVARFLGIPNGDMQARKKGASK